MPLHKHKKGKVSGVTAYALFGIFLGMGFLTKWILTTTGLIPQGELLEDAMYYIFFGVLFLGMFYVLSSNVYNQGVVEGRSYGS